METGVLVVAVAVLALVMGEDTASEASSLAEVRDYKEEVVFGINDFSMHLYQEASAVVDGNVVISPFSAAVLLALTRHGAGGSTAKEIAQALGLPSDRRATNEAYKSLLDKIQSNSELVTLRNANKLYIQMDNQLKESFRDTAKASFGVDMDEINFKSSEARVIINKWAESVTQGKIKNLFRAGILANDTLLAFANAVYLKASWSKPFESKKTDEQPFNVDQKTKKQVPTMHGVFIMNYAEPDGLNATILKLDYHTAEEGNMDMIILLPKTIDGLHQLEVNLQRLDLGNIASEIAEVTLSIPKFRVESEHNLKERLQQMGIQRVFEPDADLRGMVEPGVFVDSFMQKTFISIDENGTEAAVASGQNVSERANHPQRTVKIDRPFLFLIRHENTLLFLGRVYDPLSTVSSLPRSSARASRVSQLKK